ncbi:hypothetical protein GCM10027174_12010 [Salinifilum aidingensis]
MTGRRTGPPSVRADGPAAEQGTEQAADRTAGLAPGRPSAQPSGRAAYPSTRRSSGRPPHMRRRPDETQQQYRERLSRSCYRCGWYSTDAEELDAHEDQCTAGGAA